MPTTAKQAEHLLEAITNDEAILAVILFGSRARGDSTAMSDYDVCLVLHPNHATQDDQVAVRLRYMPFQGDRLDLRIFQQLPIYVRHRVLKEGQVLFDRDEDLLYAVACRTATIFEDFKPFYRDYLSQVACAGS
jgi:predicted nucleotidyltransferase